MRRAKQTLHKHMKHAGYLRWFRALVAVVLLASLAIPALNWIDGMKAYAISPEAEKVIGKANKNLSAKFSYDQQGNRWQFNKNGVAALAANIAKQQGDQDTEGVAGALSQLTAQQVGGGGKNDTSLYSVDLPVKGKRGITYYDNVSRLSFTMVPDFPMRDGKMVQDRLVYPFVDGGQIIYTAKTNGLKEDIVLSKYIGDTLRYSYDLKLPESLSAKLLDDGSIGIYSASPTLFGNISFSNNEDKARIMDARKNGTKDHLMFAIPAPFIKDQNGNAGHTKYLLNGSRLTVVADQLKSLKYPLTVDPSVLVTSSSDFTSGENEGMISYATSGQATRDGITGGGLGAGWVNATGALSNVNVRVSTAVVNGRIYALVTELTTGAGTTGLWYTTASNGTLAPWTKATAANPSTGMSLVAYNGYLYVFGGSTGTFGGSDFAFAQNERYAKPQANGDVTSWTQLQATSPWGPRFYPISTAYNGYMYLHGGCTGVRGVTNKQCDTTATDTWKAPINADGKLGTWTQESGATPTANMTSLRFMQGMVAYNGYLYIAGGCILVPSLYNCDNYSNDVSSAKINSDGSLGAWRTENALGISRGCTSLEVYNGYLYMVGGSKGQNCNYAAGVNPEYAPIYANGSVGAWQTTSVATTGGTPIRSSSASFIYDGYMYMSGGCKATASGNCSSAENNSISAKIDTAGATSTYYGTGTYDTAGRTAFATTTYNNYIYIIGGNQGNTGGAASMVGSTRYAPVAADGSIGAWQTASSNFNNTASAGHTCSGGCVGRTGLAAATYNGYLYIAGGNTGGNTTGDWSDVQSAVICTGVNAPVSGCAGAGDLRNWTTIFADFTTNSTTTYTSTNGRGGSAMVIYNGVMYIIGGANGGGSTLYDKIYQSTLTTTGGAGNFSQSNVTLPSTRKGVKSFATSNRLYIIGGGNGAAWTSKVSTEVNDVRFVPINPDGSLDNVTGWKDANAVGNGGSGSTFTGSTLDGHTATVSNGQVYIAGGLNNSGIAQSTVYRATINANGSMGSWSTTASFGTIRYGQATIALNGFLYIIGGCDQANILGTIDCNSTGTGDQLVSYEYSRINNGGSGTTGSWTAQTTSGAGRADHGGTEYNGYLYVVGGCTSKGISTAHACSGITPDTRYASISSDGTIGTWNPGTALPADRGGLVSLAYNGYIYAIGGCLASGTNACTSYSNNVLYAPICDGVLNTGGCSSGAGNIGKIGSWNQAGTFTTGRFGHSAVIYNGYMYVMNGCSDMSSTQNCTTFQSDVQYAQINSNGTVGNNTLGTGTFSPAGGSNAPSGRYKQSAVAYGGRLYIIGGCSAMASGNCTGIQADTSVISIDGSGTLSGSWVTDRTLPTARYGSSAVGYNGYLYIVGGCSASSGGNCTGNLGEIQVAPVLSSGSLGAWSRSVSDFASPGRFGQAAVIAKGYLVITGGNEATNSFISQSRSAPVSVQSRVGKYSKLLSISPTTDVAGVYYNGTLPAGSSVTYKVAPDTGIFGAVTPAIQGAGSEPTPLCGLGTIYYVQLMATIDDSTTATFPESNNGNVTDMTVYYRQNATPPPNLRMTGGKWFWNESVRPLDTCKQTNP